MAMNVMDAETRDEANMQVCLNLYCYVAGKISVKNDTSFKSIVDSLYKDSIKNKDNWADNERDILNSLRNAVKNNPELANCKIGDQTNLDTSGKWSKGLNACTFTTEDGKVSVVYRGTAKGEWLDNGEGLAGIPEDNDYTIYNPDDGTLSHIHKEVDYATDQQVEASNWFNELAYKHHWTEDTNITVSGHSKGGNKAQFVTMHSSLVDRCISFDGQGYSPEALAQMKEELGEEYDVRTNKIFSVSAQNDYVNVLGCRLMPEENIYYVKSPESERKFWLNHFCESLVDDNGRLYEDCEQGELSEYMEALSDALMDLPPETREACAMAVMQLIQNKNGKPIDPNDEISEDMYEEGIRLSLGIAFYVLCNKKGGFDMVRKLFKGLIDEVIDESERINRKFGAVVTVQFLFAFSGSMLAYYGVVVFYIYGDRLTDEMKKVFKPVVDKIKEVMPEMYEYAKNFIASVINFASVIFNKFKKGNTSNSAGTYISVNTGLMREYAAQLRAVNSRLSQLDSNIDRLYGKVEYKNFYDLLGADMAIGYDNKIQKCVEYLEATADDFDRVEKSLQ